MERTIALPLEEKLNAATHGLGLVASLAALPFLIRLAAQRGDGLVVLGITIFAISLVSVYAASTVYHATRPGPRKDFWLRMDYCAIYFFIAGTYTPIMLGSMRGPAGWAFLVVVWTVAALGMYLKARHGPKYPLISTLAYLAMGWCALFMINPLLHSLGWDGFKWLMAGGVAYTVGVIFFACDDKMRFGHCAWHLFVLGGSACHVVAVLGYGIRLPH